MSDLNLNMYVYRFLIDILFKTMNKSLVNIVQYNILNILKILNEWFLICDKSKGLFVK